MGQVLKLPAKQSTLGQVHSSVHDVNVLAATELFENRKYHAAIVATKRVIAICPNSQELWTNIGSYFFHVQEYAEAEAALRRALAINPNYILAHANIALVLEATNRIKEALEHFNKALELDPTNKSILWGRSLLYLRTGDYTQGFRDYESRLQFRKHRGRLVYPVSMPAPYYNGEPLKGKSVYIFAEQGLGDTILFSRFLPWLKKQGAKIFLCCSNPMVSLLWRFSDIVTFVPENVPIPKTDYSMAMGSLPHWAGVTLETLPKDSGRIKQRVEEYAADVKLQLPEPSGIKPFKIGVCWRGNPEQERDAERRIPFETMMRVMENPYVWAYSFQVGENSADIRTAGAEAVVQDISPTLMQTGLVGCGAALLHMDLLITSCTMVAHLAGSLGVPCWVMLPYDAYWPWLLTRNDSPWYSSVRLFRQPVPCNWHWTMNNVLEVLNKLIAERKDI